MCDKCHNLVHSYDCICVCISAPAAQVFFFFFYKYFGSWFTHIHTRIIGKSNLKSLPRLLWCQTTVSTTLDIAQVIYANEFIFPIIKDLPFFFSKFF